MLEISPAHLGLELLFLATKLGYRVQLAAVHHLLSQILFNPGDGGVEGCDVCSGLAALSVWHARMRSY
jgi:hypothetical protein